MQKTNNFFRVIEYIFEQFWDLAERKFARGWLNQLTNLLTHIVQNIIWHFLLVNPIKSRQSAFSPVVRIGTPPPHHPQASVPPPLWFRGEAYSLAGEGVGESQFRGGDVHCGILYIYVLCDACALPSLHASGDTKKKNSPQVANLRERLWSEIQISFKS